MYLTVRLSRLRGLAHVLVRRPFSGRRREHPTHTFVLPPRHVRRGWELACRELLPTYEYIRLSPALVTPIVVTSCDLPERQALLADDPTGKPNPWGTTSSPTPRDMNDDQSSSIYRYPRRIPKRLPGPSRSVHRRSDSIQIAGRASRGWSPALVASSRGPISVLTVTAASTVYRSVILLLAEHVPDRFA